MYYLLQESFTGSRSRDRMVVVFVYSRPEVSTNTTDPRQPYNYNNVESKTPVIMLSLQKIIMTGALYSKSPILFSGNRKSFINYPGNGHFPEIRILKIRSEAC